MWRDRKNDMVCKSSRPGGDTARKRNRDTVPETQPGAHRQTPSAFHVRRRAVSLGLTACMLGFVSMALAGCSLFNGAFAGSPPPSAVQDFSQASNLSQNNHCDKAIPLYLSALTKDGTFVNAYKGLGLCYQAIGDFGSAISTYDKAIKVDPTNFGLYQSRAGAQAVSGNTGAATNDLEAALRFATKQSSSYSSIAGSFASYGDFADAVVAMDKAIALTPSEPSLYKTRGDYYLQEPDNARAIQDYKRAIDAAPGTSKADYYADLASAYHQMIGYTNSAYAALHAAIQLQPGNPSYYVQDGDYHQAAGAFPQAMGLYDQALRIAKTGSAAEAAYEGKGDVLAAQGRKVKALAEYKLALKQTSKKNPADVRDVRPRLQGKIQGLRSS